MRTSTTKIECDYCHKIFYLPDPPEQPTEGIENVKEIINAMGEKEHFCDWRCILQYGVDFLKKNPSSNSAHKAMEELENLPQTADNFSLRD